MSKRVAMVLSGCGVKDGSEIHESVFTLFHIWKSGAQPVYYAPQMPQSKVINHLTGQASSESRDMLTEAARIARGAIKPLDQLNVADADAIVFPGGVGAATNLCNFAEKGSACSVIPDVARAIEIFHSARKPIGAICIAPVVLAKILGRYGVSITIGNDSGVADQIREMGAKHVDREVDEIECDLLHRVVTTPAYMLAKNPLEIEIGIARLVHKLVELIA